jgi:predicted Zn-dependent protease
MSLDPTQSRKLLDKVLGLGKKIAAGADVSAQLSSSHTGNTRFARNQITSSGDVEEQNLTVDIAFGKRHAAASTNQLDDASLAALVERAARLARLAPEDPERMPPLGAQKYGASAAHAYDASTDVLAAEVRANAAAAVLKAGQAKQLETAGFYQHGGQSVARADAAGLFAYHKKSSVSFSCTARTADGSGSGWAGAASNRNADVDAAAAGAIAVDKAVRSAKPRKLEPGRYTVILDPAAVAELTGFLTGALDARSADEGRSFFARPGGGNKLGDAIFGPEITLRSDPADAALGASPFDGEGLPSPAATWIDRGKLTRLVYSRFWAQKQGKAPTGRPEGLQLVGGTTPRAELLKGVKRGVLITRFWYTRWVDPQSMLITGLTRDGVFLVENGDVVAPVNNFRFNESPVTMLKNVEAMSPTEVAPDATMRVPALRTAGFNLASISDAV